MNRDGFTLLETMVALVILSLVAVGYLEFFGGAARTSRSAEVWTRVVTYAEEGMELAKLDLRGAVDRGIEPLEPGFERSITNVPIDGAIQLVTVTIGFPHGGRFALNRLTGNP